LNYWQGDKVWVDRELRLLRLGTSNQVHLRRLPGVHRRPVYGEFLVKNSEFAVPFCVLKGNSVSIVPWPQFDLDLKPHRNVGTAAGEVLGFHQVPYSIHTPGDLL
jgi:aromatic ring-cleaving dioxygenase